MCTYAAGNTERGWEADCYTSAAYIAAAAAKFETENCSVQADLDTIIKSCASASESAFNDTAKAELAAMVSGWGNATNKIACALPMDPTPAVCPKDASGASNDGWPSCILGTSVDCISLITLVTPPGASCCPAQVCRRPVPEQAVYLACALTASYTAVVSEIGRDSLI